VVIINTPQINKNNLIPEDDETKIIIKIPRNVSLNLISSALLSFTNKNYILFDKDYQKNTILQIVSKTKLDKSKIKELENSILSQIQIYNLHKNKLEKHKEFVNFVTDIILKTNNPNLVKPKLKNNDNSNK